MSDSLEKLVEVERAAARLVSEAELEAGKRKSQARMAAQVRFAEESKRLAAESATAMRALEEQLRAERGEKNRAYRESLAGRSLDKAAFSKLISERIRELAT